MPPVSGVWKHRTGFVCVVADRDYLIKFVLQVLLKRFAFLLGDIYPNFSHHLYRLWPDNGFLGSGREDLIGVPGQMAQESFSHL